jgi:flavodoxin
MNIGIIVYSQTGNTLSVAQKLEKALVAKNHKTEIARIETSDNDPKTPLKLKTAPDVSRYDVIIFASPVQAFSLAQAMKMYLSQINSLTGKKVFCFVTQGLKKPWMGGNRSIKQIETACKIKGSPVIESGIINWSSPARETQIDDIINRFNVVIGVSK